MTPRTFNLLLVCAMALTLVGACGEEKPRSAAPTATLEVVNQTPSDQEVFFEGRRLGTVRSGTRVRYRFLPPGTADLAAQGAPLADSPRRAADLHPDVPYVWELTAGDATLPLPPPLGILAVENRLGRDVKLTLDGLPLGNVFAFEKRVFGDVPSGDHTLEAVSLVDDREVRTPVRILPAVVTTFPLSAPMGSLRVVNDWDEPVALSLGESRIATIPPRATHISEYRFAGVLVASATGLRTAGTARTQLEIRDGEVTEWRLSAAGGAIEIENASSVSLIVAVDGEARAVARAGETAKISPLSPGAHRVEVAATEGTLRLARSIHLGGGERARWLVDPRYGTFRVRNSSLEPVLLYLDGQQRRTLEPTEEYVFTQVATGRHSAAIVGLRSRTRQDTRVSVSAETQATWDIRGPAGRLSVENGSGETLRIFLDAKPQGRVAPGATVVLEPVPAGDWLVEAVGDDTGRVLRHPARIAQGETHSWIARLPEGAVLVVNRSGETLVPSPALRAQHDTVPDGSTLRFRVPVGRVRLQLRGQRTGLPYALDAVTTDGPELRWEIAPPAGSLVVHNRSREPMRIALDGAVVAEVPDGRDLTLEEIEAGDHVLQASGRGSGAVLVWRVKLAPERQAQWTLEPQFARLRVWNRTSEPLEVSVDDAPFGLVTPGEILMLGGLIPGRRAVSARGLDTGLRHGAELDVAIGRVDVWQVKPANGVVSVINPRPAAVVVALDGQVIGSAPPLSRGKLVFDATTGEHQVDVWEGDYGRMARTLVSVAPDRTISLEIPSAEVRLRIRNATEAPLRIFERGRLLGEVGPDAVLDATAPHAPRLELRAVTLDGLVEWRHLVIPSARGDARWTVAPPPAAREGDAR